MKTHAKWLTRLCIILAFASLVWLGYNSLMYLEITKLFVRPHIYLNLMAVGLLIFFINHLIIISSAVVSLKNSPGMSTAGIILIVLGVISLVSLLFHFVALDQLEQDFQYGDPFTSMLKLALNTQVVVISFFLYSLIYFTIIKRQGERYSSTKSVAREQIFLTLNILGIVCSTLGILLVLFNFLAYRIVQLEIDYKVIPYFIVLVPYMLILILWGIRRFRDKRSGWNDEKENSDINRSGMVALLVSLAMTIIMAFLFHHKISELFKNIEIEGVIIVLLPFYSFVALLVFSGSALYNFKIN